MRIAKLITPLAMVLAGSSLLAQETTGTLIGTIRTKAGQPVPGATVRISSPKMLQERVVVTNEKGDYRIPLLPTGTFSIHFNAKGFLANHGSFNIVAGQTLRQDGILPEDQVSGTTVEVMAQVARVDKTETVTQTSLNVDDLETLGFLDGGGTNFLFGLLASAPGVNGNDFSASIRGGVGAGANITMNGGTVRSMVKNLFEMRVTVEDMVESMAVIQSPLNAKYGNSDGGTVAFTTSRGTNEFSGSIRRTAMTRDSQTNTSPNQATGFWGAAGSWDQNTYGNKLGQRNNAMQAPSGSDLLGGEWNITLKGPIWKDHITFAYAGVLQGTTYNSLVEAKSYSDVPQPTDTQSTYYKDPTNGTVIRQAQLSYVDGQLVSQTHVNNWNQYTVFCQINTSNELDFGYTEEVHSDPIVNGSWSGTASWPGIPDGIFKQDRTIENLGYKSVLGNNGVLDFRISKKKEAYMHPTTAAPGVQTWIGQNNIPDGTTGVLRPANNAIDLWLFNTPGLMENGRSYGDHDTLITTTDSLNYQQLVDFHGMHVIDAGINDLGAEYDSANAKDRDYATFGRISTAYPNAAYAGQYIVIPYNATVSDVIGGGDYNYGGLNIPGSTLFRNANAVQPLPIMTQMIQNAGPTNGVFKSNDRGYYLNDQWTINEHHSIMAGLRLDNFKVWDATHTVIQYNQLTPRFEYKFDVKGDQARVFNFSYGQFADTPQSFFFFPYTQQYLPYSTTQLWTGAANPSPNTANPNAPYLVTLAQLTNPANYAAMPGSIIAASMAGAQNLSDQLNPDFRGPVSTEVTLGFRRNLSNGSYYRITYVDKSWRHLFDYFPAASGATQTFPQAYFPGVQPTQVLPRILENDPNVHRTYKSIETEWNFVFTPKVTFGGNLTYSRLMANDAGPTLDNSMAQGKSGKMYDRNWYSYLNTFLPASNNNPESLRAGSGTTIHGWLSYDMTVGKLKQSVVLLGNYLPGTPYSNYSTLNIPTPTIPNYNSQVNLPSKILQYYDGQNRFSTADTWSLNLRYNQEMPVYKKLTWFSIIAVNNVLNTIANGGYALAAQSGQGDWNNGATPTALVGGPQINRDTRAAAPLFGFRTVTFETGLRF